MTKHTPPMVLVVDDEIAAATMLKHVFEREGYQVELAATGVKALELAHNQLPDLILLDIQMPEMDGFEVLRRLRENNNTAAIPTIVVSARARRPSDVAMGLNIGADDYMSKPFAPQELLARARSKMRARQLEETLQQRKQELETLLRVSEELNRHLGFDELFAIVLYLTLDLIPGEIAFVAHYNEDGQVETYRLQNNSSVPVNDTEISAIVAHLERINGEHVWNHTDKSHFGYRNGMILPLSHGQNRLGALMVASDTADFDNNHKMLFRGITRQASLALHNAELYEIQANYALHLEDMVTQRTEELKRTQQLLFRSEKLASIGNLAASIAHEINNPLQPIQLNLEYLIEDAQANQPIDLELISMTQDSVKRISRIVRQLLEFTKSSSSLGLSNVNLTNVLNAIIKLNQKALEHADITVVRDFQDVPNIQANRDQLEQVFMNIILNAKAAMEEHNQGKITIRLWHESHGVKIQFRDTGIGISEEIIDRIFDPFVSTKPSGTGLGLFVTYSIIEKHQGEIEVDSTIGQGTTFTITLPQSPGSVQLTDSSPS